MVDIPTSKNLSISPTSPLFPAKPTVALITLGRHCPESLRHFKVTYFDRSLFSCALRSRSPYATWLILGIVTWPPVAANGGKPVTETADQALRNDLEDVYGRYEELRSGVDELQRSLATMQVNAESPEGAVRATVDSDGRLVDLRLDQAACRQWDPATLSRVIVETVQQATAGTSRQIENLVTTHRPGDSEA